MLENWLLPQLNTNYDDYFSIVFFNSAGSDVLEKETTTFSLGHPVWDEFDYRVDVCHVAQGAYIEGV
jgi:hypothetical protein